MTLGELIEKLGGKLVQGSLECDLDGVQTRLIQRRRHRSGLCRRCGRSRRSAGELMPGRIVLQAWHVVESYRARPMHRD